jgi:hypothetical protein
MKFDDRQSGDEEAIAWHVEQRFQPFRSGFLVVALNQGAGIEEVTRHSGFLTFLADSF